MLNRLTTSLPARHLLPATLLVLLGVIMLTARHFSPLQAESLEPAAPDIALILIDPDVQNHAPGSQFDVRFRITNDQPTDDTFRVRIDSVRGWPVQVVRLIPPAEGQELVIPLAAGTSLDLLARVTIPADATGSDQVILTAITESNPNIRAVRTFAVSSNIYVWLPIILNRYPPVPDVPVLNAIDNADKDGNYTVSWQPAQLATSYRLQRADNAEFDNATVVYTGTATSFAETGRPGGTWYYRVEALNENGSSGFSNVQSTLVEAGLFQADVSSIQAGQCTTLRWNFTNVRAVYVSFAHGFDKRAANGVDTFSICPSVNTTYRASVINQDNSQSEYAFTVNVTGNACGDPYVQTFAPTTTLVNRGERFSISWDVKCARGVYYKVGTAAEVPVTGVETRTDVTIQQDTLFSLRVVYNNRGTTNPPSDNASFTVRVR